MESNANFIPLGGGSRTPQEDGLQRSNPVRDKAKVIGKTKEERKEIARQVRLAARKEKKKIKADAKRQRKQNAIMHRRATRNNEKYSKNKDRNKQRAIDLERQKIRHYAVRQAEQLAGKHDQTGKLFNVGEVLIMPDGSIKSKESIAKAEEAKRKREIEKAEEEAFRKRREDFKDARRQAHRAQMKGEELPEDVLNRAFYKENPRPQKISKNQQARREMLAPKPVPPKPVIPEGYSIPKGEEDFLALWDITDQDIQKRLSDAKRNKKMAAKQLRRVQKEAKKFNRAMKVKKKMAANAGILWDPDRAKREILAQANGPKEEGDDSSSDSDSDSDSGSDSDSSDSGDEQTTNGKHEVSAVSDATSGNISAPNHDGTTKKKKKIGKFPGVRLNLTLLAEAERIEAARKEKKRLARDQRRAARKVAAAAEEKAAEEAKLAKSAAKRELKRAERAAQQAAQQDAAPKVEREALDYGVAKKKRKRAAEENEVVTEETSHKKIKADVEESAPAVKPSKKSKKSKQEPEPKEEAEVDLIGAVEAHLDGQQAEKKKKKKSKTQDNEIESPLELPEVSEKKKKRKHSDEGNVENQDAEKPEKKKKKKKALETNGVS